MSRSTSGVLAALVLAIATWACDDTPQPTGPVEDSPSYNFMNGPSDLPLVFRVQGTSIGAIRDPDSDLVVFAGLPEVATDLAACGGDEGFTLHDFQVVSLAHDVFMVLAQADVYLHVYRLSTFNGVCRTTPLASGAGNLVVTDNDATVSGTRANAFGASMSGQVVLADGSAGTVSAHSRLQIGIDGEFRVLSRSVNLTGD